MNPQLLLMFCILETIYPASVQIVKNIHLAFPTGEGYCYYSQKIPILLRGKIYCLNCLHCFTKESKLESHKKVLRKQIFL